MPPSELRRLAERLRSTGERFEPAITGEVRAAVDGTAGALVDMESRLKEVSSIERKIEDIIRHGRGSVNEADISAGGIDDAVRYRLVVEESAYAVAEREVVENLQRRGMKAVRRPQGWGRAGEYPGLNVTFRVPEGLLFEVQFHTPASLRAISETRSWYEQMKTAKGADYRRLRSQTGRVFRDVPLPPGVTRRYD